ncbi:MAG: diguanylate cyclase [Spirochaetales bacterium]|nr:diguanylate cyclase [Spirochaetales bacterium]
MDILSRIESNDDVLDSPGSVNISIGGSAGNVAMNLAVAGEPVRLLSAMNDSAYSRIIKSHLNVLGIDPCIVTDPNLPLSAFVAHINRQGEIRSAVSSMPVERLLFTQNIMQEALVGVDALIMECNLSSENISALALAAHKKGVPVYLGAVSEAKAVRALALMDSEIDLSSGIFCNAPESERLLSLSGCGSLERLSTIIGPLIVTHGPAGACVYHNSKKTLIANDLERIIEIPSGNFLGAGDLLMSETIRNLVRGCNMNDAVFAGVLKAREVIERVNCNLGANDIIERIINQTQIQSQNDNLTGLLNRAAMLNTYHSIVTTLKRNHRSLSLILLDLDHFKHINDTMGHETGDVVLKAFAEVLKKVFRESDAVSRWGGEEFLILMPETSLDSAMEAGERLQFCLSNKPDLPRPVTVSGGVVEIDYLEESLFEAVKRADLLLYAAKRKGRNLLIKEIQISKEGQERIRKK